MAPKKISVKILVHKEKNQVLFAESGKDFVDILLSFLTMPMGTIVKLTGKQSNVGCMNMLYESVEDLDMQLLQTESCKNMLLHPKSDCEEQHKSLMVKIDNTEPTKYYICGSQWPLSSETNHVISTVSNVRCLCGGMTDWRINKYKPKIVEGGEDGVFVKGTIRFMITDDLQVSPVCMTGLLELLKKHVIGDATVLEERNVNVGRKEVLHLLKCLLQSNTPLTDVFLPEKTTIDGEEDLDHSVIVLDSKEIAQTQTKKEIGNDSKKMSVKLLLSKSSNKVYCAQVGQEFADLLFSFLAFPLGSVVKCLGGCTSMRCVDNLYKSVEVLNNKDYMKSEECKDLLVDPKLAPYYGSTNQLLQINEQVPCQLTIFNCFECIRFSTCVADRDLSTCSHGCGTILLGVKNPKLSDVVTKLGGAFLAGPATFMVTDELIVKPLSAISIISLLGQFKVPSSDLEERIVSIEEEEAVSLLKASLISKTVLSNVFSSKKPTQLQMG